MQLVSSGQANNASIHAQRKLYENACKDHSNRLGNRVVETLHQRSFNNDIAREAMVQRLNARHSNTGGSKSWNDYSYADSPRSSSQAIYLTSSHVRDCCALSLRAGRPTINKTP
jgi:hypothetical protein